MDLTLEIDTKNQQKYSFNLYTIQQKNRPRSSTRSCCLLVQNPKATDQETKELYEVCFIRIKQQIDEKRSTADAHWNDVSLLECKSCRFCLQLKFPLKLRTYSFISGSAKCTIKPLSKLLFNFTFNNYQTGRKIKLCKKQHS